MSTLRTLIRTTAYPGTLLIAGVAMMWLLDAGVDEGLASLGVSAGSAVVALALERWLVWEPAWARPHGDVRTDLAHAFLSGGLVEGSRIALFAGLTVVASGLSGQLGGTLWPNDWPLALQVVLGASGRTMAVFLAVIFAHARLQHSNADLRLGPLNWIFAGPELHRWHHSHVLAEQKTNYGTVLIVWDVVFGTRHLPPTRPPIEVGLGGLPAYPTRYLGQLASPFQSKLWHPTPTLTDTTAPPPME